MDSELIQQAAEAASRAGVRESLIKNPFADNTPSHFVADVARAFLKAPAYGADGLRDFGPVLTKLREQAPQYFGGVDQAGGDSQAGGAGATGGGRTWRRSEIAQMNEAQYAEQRGSINEAMKAGRFIDDIAGPPAAGDRAAVTDGSAGGRTWRRSEIAQMSEAQYAEQRGSINEALKAGRIIDDIG